LQLSFARSTEHDLIENGQHALVSDGYYDPPAAPFSAVAIPENPPATGIRLAFAVLRCQARTSLYIHGYIDTGRAPSGQVPPQWRYGFSLFDASSFLCQSDFLCKT
jgi:hypothetical protein